VAHINIEFTLFSAFYSPLISVMSGGFLKDEGLEADWTVSPPGVSAVKALEEGRADIIQSAPSQAFTKTHPLRYSPEGAIAGHQHPLRPDHRNPATSA
jgi:hypothetical protein